MKVPTYQRETARTAEVGARGLSVQASPGAVSAGTQAATQFFDQTTETSLKFYETELTNRRKIQKRKADIASEEEILTAAEQSQQMDPNESETYFDTEVERIKRTYSKQFENDLLRQNFELDLDKRALSKRIAVRANASERRVGDALTTYEIQEQQLQNRIINAETNFDRMVAQEDQDRLYDEIVESGYLSQADINKRRVANTQFVTNESYVARINAARSVEELQQIIGDLEQFKELLPSTIRTLVNASEAEIAEIFAAENRQEALETAFQEKMSAEQLEQLELRLRKMSGPDAKAYYEYALTKEGQENLQDTLTLNDRRQLLNFAEQRASKIGADKQEQISRLSTAFDDLEDIMSVGQLPNQSTMQNLGKAVSYLGHEPSARRFNELVESVGTAKVMRAMSPAQAKNYETQLRSALDAENDVAQKASLARQVSIVSKYNTNYDEAIEAGNHLDFFSNSNQITLSQFDFSNILPSIEMRKSEMGKVAAILIQGMDFGERQPPSFQTLTRGINAFSQKEAQEFARFASKLTAAEKVNLVTQLQPMAKFAPQIWGQLDKSNAKILAMAGAIGDPIVSQLIFEGQEIIASGTQVSANNNQAKEQFADHVGRIGEVFEVNYYETVFNGVLAHYAATRTNTSQSDVDDSEFLASMEAVTGGIGEWNGFKLQLPRNVDQAKFNRWIQNLTPDMLALFAPNGFYGFTAQQAVDQIKKSRLQSIGHNLYKPVFGGSGMSTLNMADGNPFYLQWNKNIEKMLPEAIQRAGFMEEQETLETYVAPLPPPIDLGPSAAEFLIPSTSPSFLGD